VFWKFASDSSESDAGEAPKAGSHLLFTRGYSVFNAAQVDGYMPKTETEMPMLARVAQADAFFAAIGATVRHGAIAGMWPTHHVHNLSLAPWPKGEQC
jgi:antirestriction protein ArdC